MGNAVEVQGDEANAPLALSVGIGYFGQWQGGWNLGGADQIVGIGNFAGDGKAELVLRSGWGLGILAPNGWGGLTSVEMHANGEWIGGWNLGAYDYIVGYGDVSGTGHDALIIESAWGIGALGRQCWQGEQWFYCTPTLTSLAMSQWETMAGSWKARQGDDLSGIGDFDGDGRVDLLFHHY